VLRALLFFVLTACRLTETPTLTVPPATATVPASWIQAAAPSVLARANLAMPGQPDIIASALLLALQLPFYYTHDDALVRRICATKDGKPTPAGCARVIDVNISEHMLVTSVSNVEVVIHELLHATLFYAKFRGYGSHCGPWWAHVVSNKDQTDCPEKNETRSYDNP